MVSGCDLAHKGLKGLWSSLEPDPFLLNPNVFWPLKSYFTVKLRDFQWKYHMWLLLFVLVAHFCNFVHRLKGVEDTGKTCFVSFLTVSWAFWLIWKTCARSGSHWAPLTPFLSPPWHYFLQKWTVPSHQSSCAATVHDQVKYDSLPQTLLLLLQNQR